MVSGFVFDEEDFVMPWGGQIDNLERFDRAVNLLAEVLLKGLQRNRLLIGSKSSLPSASSIWLIPNIKLTLLKEEFFLVHLLQSKVKGGKLPERLLVGDF